MPAFRCTLLSSESPFSACWIHFGHYPLAPVSRSQSRPLLAAIQTALEKRKWNGAPYLQVSFLHHEDQWIPLSAAAARVLPVQGLGVLPEKPPHQFTPEDMAEIDPNKPFQSFIDNILFLKKLQMADMPIALTPFYGLGSTMCLGFAQDSETSRDTLSKQTEAVVADPSFRIFPFYVPLLHPENWGMLKTDALDFYFRETPNHEGVFLMSRGSIVELRKGGGVAVKETAQGRVVEFSQS
jgi:hypothetical protein